MSTIKEKRLLVVEDDATTQQLLAAVLQDQLMVSCVTSGEEAVNVFKKDLFDIVLMDVTIEGSINGIEAAREILRVKRVPIIGLTADGSPETVAQCKDAGMLRVLVKPVEKEQLFRALRVVSHGLVKAGAKVCLIVDDDPTFRELARHRLIDYFGRHADVVIAENGSQAVQMVEERVFDVILMDAKMPGMDGITCAELIRANKAAVQPKILGISANGFQELDHYSPALDDFISKPLSSDSIRTALKSVDSFQLLNSIKFLKVDLELREDLVSAFVQDVDLILLLVKKNDLDRLSTAASSLLEAAHLLGAERAAHLMGTVLRSVESHGSRFIDTLGPVLQKTVHSMLKLQEIVRNE